MSCRSPPPERLPSCWMPAAWRASFLEVIVDLKCLPRDAEGGAAASLLWLTR